MARPLDDLGPDFDRRWKQASRARRREFVAELRDLYVMLEEDDAPLLARLRNGSIPAPRDPEPEPDLPLLAPEPGTKERQRGLFDEAGPTVAPSASAVAAPAPEGMAAARPARENPFLPRSVLDRLQQSRDRASAGLRDLLQTTADDLRSPAATTSVAAPESAPATASSPSGTPPLPPTHEQSDLERELRLKLGPMVETLIEAQMEQIKSELRVRLRLEMDRLIAEHIRK